MLPEWYNQYKELIEKSLNKYLIDYFNSELNTWLSVLKESALYSVKWWKRIRAILALEFYLSFTKYNFANIKYDDDIIKFCIALELLHVYSLIHDDLPAMDNDILRRWEATVWKKYWEANAILVWDMLNSMAFEILWELKWSSVIIKYFGQAVWIKWMLWWQVLDLYYEKNPDKLTIENLIEVHNKKTWALIECSIIWWIIIAEWEINFVKDEESNNIKRFLDFWQKIGLAFQVKDDLLDVEWTIEETGKSVWDWEEKWFVYFLWIEKTKKYLDDLILESNDIINELDSDKLNFLVEYIWNRKK
jgi:geranylgeranyl diphosphate synthase type II